MNLSIKSFTWDISSHSLQEKKFCISPYFFLLLLAFNRSKPHLVYEFQKRISGRNEGHSSSCFAFQSNARMFPNFSLVLINQYVKQIRLVIQSNCHEFGLFWGHRQDNRDKTARSILAKILLVNIYPLEFSSRRGRNRDTGARRLGRKNKRRGPRERKFAVRAARDWLLEIICKISHFVLFYQFTLRLTTAPTSSSGSNSLGSEENTHVVFITLHYKQFLFSFWIRRSAEENHKAGAPKMGRKKRGKRTEPQIFSLPSSLVINCPSLRAPVSRFFYAARRIQ